MKWWATSPNITQLRVLIDKIAPTNSREKADRGPAGSGMEVARRLIYALPAPRRQRLRRHQLRHHGARPAGGRTVWAMERWEGPRKTGLFELAHNGTLYLDEVSDMPLETQGKILRVLIDQIFTRVGGQSRVQVDARVDLLHHTRS